MIGDLDEMSNMPMDLESTHYTGTGWTNVAPSSPFDQDLNTTDDVQLASVGVGVTPDADAALAVSGQYYGAEYDAGNSGTALAIDWSNGNTQIVTLTDDCTFTFSHAKAGGRYLLILVQDATGGRTVTWPSDVKWSGGTAPTLTATASAVDLVTLARTAAVSGIYVSAANLDIR